MRISAGDKVEYIGPEGCYKKWTPKFNVAYTVDEIVTGRCIDSGIAGDAIGTIKPCLSLKEIDSRPYVYLVEHFRKLETFEDVLERIEFEEVYEPALY